MRVHEPTGWRVDDEGQVYGGRWQERRIGWVAANGYLYSGASGRRTLSLHRVVYETLIGPIPEGYEINHKNGVKTDNRPANLEAVTRGENQRHAWANGFAKAPPVLRGRDHPASKITRRQAAAIRRRIACGETQRSIGRRFGVHQAVVSEIATGKHWTSRSAR